MASNGTTNPKIIFYTNHGCPYAQRAQIALSELKLPFEEVIIDLDNPRPQWYLDINPRGLVPSIKYTLEDGKEEIITESAIVAQFLADSHPSHLLPASDASPSAALQRARTNFFVDTWNTKIAPFQLETLRAQTPEDKEAKAEAWAAAIEKEIEPLLADAKPFFGGSEKFTFVEVITAPFLLRWSDFAKDGELVPKSLNERLEKLPNFSKWAKATVEAPVATEVYDSETILKRTKARISKMLAKH